MWEKAHEWLIGLLKKKWKSTGKITLTEHIASFRGIIARIVRACKHILTILHQQKENRCY